MGRWSEFGRVKKRIATPARGHGNRGGDAYGHQTDDCTWCGEEVERWLRPRLTGQSRGWRHAASQSEYCYDGIFTDVIPEGA